MQITTNTLLAPHIDAVRSAPGLIPEGITFSQACMCATKQVKVLQSTKWLPLEEGIEPNPPMYGFPDSLEIKCANCETDYAVG